MSEHHRVAHAEDTETVKGLGPRCRACGGQWPCRTVLLRERAERDAALAERDRLREALVMAFMWMAPMDDSTDAEFDEYERDRAVVQAALAEPAPSE